MNFKKHHTFFGELETDIMELLWEKECACVRDILEALSKRRSIAYTTVMTVMSRLYEKGFLKRTREQSGAYCYRAKQTKEEFCADASGQFVRYLLDEFGEVAVAQFFDILKKTDSKKLARWKKKLKESFIT